MSEGWVVNASPLILLSRIARLDLLERLAPKILAPNAVIDEVRAGQHNDQTAAIATQAGSRLSMHLEMERSGAGGAGTSAFEKGGLAIPAHVE